VVLIEAESRRSTRSLNPDAFDLVIRARALRNRSISKESTREAVRLFEQALLLAPDDVQALTGLAIALADVSLTSLTPKKYLDRAEALATRALALDPHNAWCRLAMGIVRHLQSRFDEAINELEAAIRLNPNLHAAHLRLGGAKVFAGSPDEALPHFLEMIRLSPRDPTLNLGYWGIGWARFHRGDLDGAIEMLRKSIALRPYSAAYLYLAAAYALQGLGDEAKVALAAFRATGAPKNTIAAHRAFPNSTHRVFLAQRERLYEGLRKAGMPEE
jgi:tetratricopeptide (TPR) repeat protein